MHTYFRKLQYTNSLIAFICSVNFMFLCSYCATLGKIEGKVSLGEVSCNSERDCVANAYCMDGHYCMCKDDYVQDSDTNMCLPRVKYINDSCIIDIQCTSSFGTHSFCYKTGLSSETGHCRCTKNAHFQDGICYESVHLGGLCKVSDNCISSSNVATYCAYSICVCAAGYHPSDDRLDCVPNVDLGKKCKKDEDCVAQNSHCSDVCHCQMGYVNSDNGTTCLSAAKNLRAECVENSQCLSHLPNTHCDSRENVCECVPFSHEFEKSCWISSRLGESCTHPNQCVTPSLSRSVVSCSHGMCHCADGYTRVEADCAKQQDDSAESSTLEKCIFLIVAAVLLSLPSDR